MPAEGRRFSRREPSAAELQPNAQNEGPRFHGYARIPEFPIREDRCDRWTTFRTRRAIGESCAEYSLSRDSYAKGTEERRESHRARPCSPVAGRRSRLVSAPPLQPSAFSSSAFSKRRPRAIPGDAELQRGPPPSRWWGGLHSRHVASGRRLCSRAQSRHPHRTQIHVATAT